MNKFKEGKFYIMDFLKRLMKPRNIPVILYLLIDSVFIFAALMIFGALFFGSVQNGTLMTVLCIIFSIIIYIGAIVLSLSPIGEKFLRLKYKCEEIADPQILNRIEPLFQEVNKKAKQLDPTISDNIKLYIQQEDEPNAFAMGRSTVCITSALLQYDDEQIKAVLAHEFGHLANKDTDLTLVVNVANTFIHLMFLFAWAVLFVYKIIIKIVTICASLAGESVGAMFGNILDIVYTALAFVFIRLAEKLWNIIGNLVIMFSSRGSEFNADVFAQNLGYGDGLIAFFEILPDAKVGKKTSFKLIIDRLATIGESHPATWRRIENLKKNVNSTPVKVISEAQEESSFREISEN